MSSAATAAFPRGKRPSAADAAPVTPVATIDNLFKKKRKSRDEDVVSKKRAKEV
jgi:hypothetical protein